MRKGNKEGFTMINSVICIVQSIESNISKIYLYYISKRLRWGGHVARMEEGRSAS
jgi:hypothetical protein